jgi:TrmH family RNA methyltransferase
MGAIFAMPVARVESVDALPGRRIGLAARAGEALRGPLGEPATIVVGSERDGVPAGVLAACDDIAHIPIRNESLNAAVAASIALYEATRGTIDAPGAPASAASPDTDPQTVRVPPA